AFEDSTYLYVRVERQNLIGFPEVNAFLFTIRTYLLSAGFFKRR
ncbi:MAG TPA: DUF3445 domain-containing protein, partial [Sphingobacteriaceae bacterium]|nr:DUF3445 domain-containing protein [Sphingobacteriaceae bacterium]